MIYVLIHRQHRHLHILQGAQRRQQVARLKDESNLARAICVQSTADPSGLVPEQHFAAGGRIQPPSKLQQRDLPLPLGPLMARYSPAPMPRSTPRRAWNAPIV